MPYPHNPTFIPDAIGLDKLTLQDRLSDIRDKLTPTELTVFESFLAVISGAKPENASFFEMVRLWALCGYSIDGLIAVLSLFKLHDGQSAFARKFFKEALETRNLSYAFTCPVSSVDDKGQEVEVTTAAGQCFRGRRVICTIPHNILGNVTFRPPLGHLKKKTFLIHLMSTKAQRCTQRSNHQSYTAGWEWFGQRISCSTPPGKQ